MSDLTQFKAGGGNLEAGKLAMSDYSGQLLVDGGGSSGTSVRVTHPSSVQGGDGDHSVSTQPRDS